MDKIEVVRRPGALSPIDNEMLKKKRIPVTVYRNRRLGDFLHELKLAERKGTGIPSIHRAMEKNGSPKPKFEMDNDKTYFLATLKVHPESYKINKEIRILKYCEKPKTRKQILVDKLELTNQTFTYDKYIAPLIKIKYLDYTIPEYPTNINQKYKTTKKGLIYIKINTTN